MLDVQVPKNPIDEKSANGASVARSRIGLWIRALIFGIVVLGCGWYSHFFQSIWTSFSPRACADGNFALFSIDFDSYPARIGEQFNACDGVGDGECIRQTAEQTIRGECRNGRMQGAWSLRDEKSKLTGWSGNYCNGLPCSEFRTRVDAEHENIFHVENLQLHGAATIWERESGRFIEFSGRFEKGKHSGRWVRHGEPGHKLLSASIYDDNGFVSVTSIYCTNGNHREIRGKSIYLFDSQGNTIAQENAGDSTSKEKPGDNPLCPLP